ncbi:membrane protein [Aureimonas ureilytica]|uniref:Membrane protein n=1 Tax=Aureimonas ureilytica TaxID=401562 RepID=A0A147DAS4_9HYPH|nr:ABC transporter permease [Aureimonas ureilytica]KTQ98646.1 membrane protein [Aureimonas ureilytica]
MFGFIWADLRRHWAGVLAVVLLIALASVLGTCVTLGERAIRLGSARAASAFDLVIGAPGSETQLVLSSVFLQPAPLPLLPGRTLAALRADPRVAYAAPVGFGDFVGDDPVVGTTGDVVGGLGGLAEGRAFQKLQDAVVGSAVARAIGSRFKPLHGRLSEGGHVHGAISYEVVGRMKPTGTAWDKAILVPIEAVWLAHGHEPGSKDHGADETAHGEEAARGGVGIAVLAADYDQQAEEARRSVDLGRPIDPAALDRPDAPGVPAIVVKPRTIADAYKLRQNYRHDGTLAVFPAEVLTRLYGTLGDARTVLAAIAYGAQALVGAAILFVVIVHVLQRRRQIGALRAFGAPRLSIFAIVWAEIFAMVGAGVVLGFGLGFAAASLLAQVAGGASGIALPVELRAGDLTTLVLLLGAVALVTFVPASLAYRQSPAEALRG